MKTRIVALLALVLAYVFLGAAPVSSQEVVGFHTEVLASGLVQPTSIARAPDGRLFVSEQRGTIQTYDNENDPTPSLFADLRPLVHNYHDRGLLALEVDRAWPSRPYVYALYSYDGRVGQTAPVYGGTTDSDPCPNSYCPATTRIARLTADSVPTMTSQTFLLKDLCREFMLHDGGGLRMDVDGSLVASLGEGAWPNRDYGQMGDACKDPIGEGGSLRSQDLRTTSDPTNVYGAVVRIHPDTGAAWPTNPMINRSNLESRKILAIGLRNPFRLALRDGQIYVGDVGEARWEEINQLSPEAPVENFGWPCYEGVGKHPEWDGLNFQLCESLYSSNTADPPVLTYCHKNSSGACGIGPGAVSGLEFYDGTSYPAQFHGQLLFADYTKETIFAKIGAEMVVVAENVGFPVDLKSAANGDMLFPDPFTGEVKRLYYGPQRFDTPVPQPEARIDTPTPDVTWQTGGTISFSGGGTDAGGQPLPDSALHWTLVVLHCPDETNCHRHFIESREGVAAGTFVGPAHEDPARVEILLRVTDPLTGTDDQTSVVLRREAAPK